jgi:hypothetical protein
MFVNFYLNFLQQPPHFIDIVITSFVILYVLMFFFILFRKKVNVISLRALNLNERGVALKLIYLLTSVFYISNYSQFTVILH